MDDYYKIVYALWTDMYKSVVGQYSDPNTYPIRLYKFGVKN